MLRVHGPRLRVIWICGAAGAGKSVAAWALFEALATAGRRVAYVDIDQLGMLYPAADADLGRHSLKAEALAALAPGYVAAQAQVLVVSGVVDVDTGPGTALAQDVDLTLCLLSPDPAALRERILARGRDEADAEEAVAEDAVLRDATFVDVAIATSGLSVTDTVSRLREFCWVPDHDPDVAVDAGGRWCEVHGQVVCSPSDMDVVVVTGPRAAGSSTIGFGLNMGRWRAGRRTGFVDLQQLGFISGRGSRTANETTLAIGQLAVMHNLMSERGAELLVVSGQLAVSDRATLRAALRAAQVTLVRLRADSKTLREHVHSRAEGNQTRLAGDDLLDADQEHQDVVVASALDEQHVLDASAADDAVLEVSGRTATDVIAEVDILNFG